MQGTTIRRVADSCIGALTLFRRNTHHHSSIENADIICFVALKESLTNRSFSPQAQFLPFAVCDISSARSHQGIGVFSSTDLHMALSSFKSHVQLKVICPVERAG